MVSNRDPDLRILYFVALVDLELDQLAQARLINNVGQVITDALSLSRAADRRSTIGCNNPGTAASQNIQTLLGAFAARPFLSSSTTTPVSLFTQKSKP